MVRTIGLLIVTMVACMAFGQDVQPKPISDADAQATADRAQARHERNADYDAETARNLAELQGNTAKFEALLVPLQQVNAEIDLMAHKKWCHQNPWRIVRGYREPKWCK